MAFVTIRAIDGNHSKKGEVVHIRDDALYSLKTRLPRALRVEVTGATADQIEEWLMRLKDSVRYSNIAENPAGWREKMEIDPDVAAATGMDKTFKLSLKDWILNDPHGGNWEAIFFSQTIDELVCDIAKGQNFGLPGIKADINKHYIDAYQQILHFQRYFFPDSIVDPRVTQGLIDEAAAELPSGDLPSDWTHDTITKVQGQAAIIDRLE